MQLFLSCNGAAAPAKRPCGSEQSTTEQRQPPTLHAYLYAGCQALHICQQFLLYCHAALVCAISSSSCSSILRWQQHETPHSDSPDSFEGRAGNVGCVWQGMRQACSCLR
jgi:hypothetical protein